MMKTTTERQGYHHFSPSGSVHLLADGYHPQQFSLVHQEQHPRHPEGQRLHH